MSDTIRELYYWFVGRPKLDAYPEDTEHFERFFADADLDLIDAKDNLLENHGITAFREGLRLGLGIAWETAPDPGLPPRPPR